MKLILTVVSPDLETQLDPRFGRGAYFLAITPETMEWQAYPNPGVNASGGAGTLAAQFVAGLKTDAVISGDFGPNAYEALQAAGIAMYLMGDSRTIGEAVQRFKAGELESVISPTGPGHHRRGGG